MSTKKSTTREVTSMELVQVEAKRPIIGKEEQNGIHIPQLRP